MVKFQQKRVFMDQKLPDRTACSTSGQIQFCHKASHSLIYNIPKNGQKHREILRYYNLPICQITLHSGAIISL